MYYIVLAERRFDMYKKLRIAFCILTVTLVAAAIFVFIYAGWLWGLLTVILALVFGALMVTFKGLQEKQERMDNPPPPVGDFITGKVAQKKEGNENNNAGADDKK